MSSFAFSENTSQMNPKEIRALYDLIDDALKDVTSDLGLTWSTKATNISGSSGETKANSNHVNRENIELEFNPTPTPIVNNYVDNYFTHTECNDSFYFHNGFFEPQQQVALSSPPMLCINCSGHIPNNQTAHLTPPIPQQPQEVNRKRRRGSVQSSCSSNNSSPTQLEFVDFKSNNKIKKKNNKKNNYNVRFSHNLFDEMKFKKQNPQQTFFKLKL